MGLVRLVNKARVLLHVPVHNVDGINQLMRKLQPTLAFTLTECMADQQISKFDGSAPS